MSEEKSLNDEVVENEAIEPIDSKADEQKAEQDEKEDKENYKPKAPPKKKAARLLIFIAALLIIMIPVAIWANSCYENKVQDLLFQRAVQFSTSEILKYEQGTVKSAELVKVYYSEDTKFYEEKIIIAMNIKAYTHEGGEILCLVLFENGEPYFCDRAEVK